MEKKVSRVLSNDEILIPYDKLKITRVLIWSGDRVPGTGSTSDYVIQLPTVIENVIDIEWLNTSIVGTMVQIDDWGTYRASGGRLYWRFLDDKTNSHIGWWNQSAANHHVPMNVRNLHFTVFKPDGSTASVDDHFIELELYSAK